MANYNVTSNTNIDSLFAATTGLLSRIGEAVSGSNDNDARTWWNYQMDGSHNLIIDSGVSLEVSDRTLHVTESPNRRQVQVNGTLTIGKSLSAGSETLYYDTRTIVKLPANTWTTANQSHFQEDNSALDVASSGTLNLYGSALESSSPITFRPDSTVNIENCVFALYQSDRTADVKPATVRQRTSNLSVDGLTCIGGIFDFIAIPNQFNGYFAINMQRAISLSGDTPEGTLRFRDFRGLGNDADVFLKTGSGSPRIVEFINPRTPPNTLKIDLDDNTTGIFRAIYEIDYELVDSSGAAIEDATIFLEDEENTTYSETTSTDGTHATINALVGYYEELSSSGGSGAQNVALVFTVPLSGWIRSYGKQDISLTLFPNADTSTAVDSVRAINERVTLRDNPFVDTTTYPLATAAAITGVTYSSGVVTVSANKNWLDFAHYLEHEVTQSDTGIERYWQFNTPAAGTLDADLVFVGTADLGEQGTLSMGANTTVTLGTNASYSAHVNVPATGTINVDASPATVDLSNWTFADGATFEITDGGSTTITVASQAIADQLEADKTETSGTITFSAPVLTVTISGLVATSRLKIFDAGTTTLHGGVNSSSTTFAWTTGTPGDLYDIYIVLPGRESVFIKDYEFPSSSTSLPVTQDVDINYEATADFDVDTASGAGLGTTTDFWLDTANLEIQIATGNNVSQPSGVSLRKLYSGIIEARYANDSLMPYHDPVVAISATAGEFELRRGWTLKNNTTRNLLRDGGLAQYSDADALEAEYMNITGLGSITETAYYWQVDSDTATKTDCVNSGLPNQLIQIFGDASNGDFDYRDFFVITARAQGRNIAIYDLLTEQNLSELSPQRYFLPLNTSANPNLTVADTSIDANSDGTADVDPYDGMSLTWLTSAAVDDWADDTVYAQFARVEDGGNFYITVDGGTSNGTGVADDAGVTWYQIDRIFDANGGTTSEMTNYLFWLQRQDVDIDAGTGNRTGEIVNSLATTEGSNLVLAAGIWAIDFAESARLTHFPVETDGTRFEYDPLPVSFTAPNLANGAPYMILHRQVFVIASSDINTTNNTITLGTDTNGDAPAFDTSTSGRHTLVRFQLADGATMPTTSTQIKNTGSYRVLSESSGVIQIEVTEGGGAITFSDDGTDNGSSQLATLIFETSVSEGTVSGASGVSEEISLPDGATYRFKTIHQDTTGGPRKTTRFVDVTGSWSTAGGASFAETVDATDSSSNLWTEINRIADLSSFVLEDTVIDNAGNIITDVNPVEDGADISGLTFALEGNGFIQINSGAITKNASSVNGALSGQDLAMWAAYQLGQLDNIYLASDTTVVLQGLSNAIIDNVEIDETSGNLVQIYGMNIRERDGRPIVSPETTGPVVMNVATRGNVGVIETGTSGLTTTEATNLAELAATLESSGVFSTAALANAPSGSGGSAPTEAEIYTYFTASNRQDTFKADVSALSTFDASTDAVTLATNAVNADTLANDVPQIVRDAMALAPSAGTPATGSIDAELDESLSHTRPLAKQVGAVSGVTAVHSASGITVSDGDGSTTFTDNGDGTTTVAPAP